MSHPIKSKALWLILPAALMLAACSKEKKPDHAPQNFEVKAYDGYVKLTWTQEPGLTYWSFRAATDQAITSENYSRYPGAAVLWPVSSPLYLPGLSNGQSYSFVMNSTKDGGPAGPSTPSTPLTIVTPRSAGTGWEPGSSTLGTATMRASTYNPTLGYVAVGDNGNIQQGEVDTAVGVGAASVKWTARSSGSTVNLNDVTVFGGSLLAVGDGGNVLTSTDAKTWSTSSAGVTTRLNSVTSYGNSLIAVGDNGVILSSADGKAWKAPTACTNCSTANLYKVSLVGGTLWALGANGSLLSSTDGNTWTAQTSGVTGKSLYGIAAGSSHDGKTASIQYLVVGEQGTMLSSSDAKTWTVASAPASSDFYAIASGSQYLVTVPTSTTAGTLATRFVLAGAGGSLWYGDGKTWTAASSGATTDLRHLLYTRGAFLALGGQGVNSWAY